MEALGQSAHEKTCGPALSLCFGDTAYPLKGKYTMTVQHHAIHAIPTLHQAEATASQFQAVAARIAAHLAGAPGELARDDIA